MHGTPSYEAELAEERAEERRWRRTAPGAVPAVPAAGPGEVLGQDHVVRALTGSIRDGASITRSCSAVRGDREDLHRRILAKMVNCENGPTAEPCGGCEQCIAIREGTHLDVVEIDAASHGGVDDARDLAEKAPTAPVLGREKVYIIDEAQRLSREAFDALLKVFEEPPPGVRFVLATTEPHKMPATIVGRCQRFDFRRAHDGRRSRNSSRRSPATRASRSMLGAAHAIARQAEGSARDALSPAGPGRRCSAAAEGRRGRDPALLGAPRAEVQVELADAVAVGDARTRSRSSNRLVQDGQDLRNVTNETLAHFRNLLLVKTAPGQADLLDVPDDVRRLCGSRPRSSAAELARVIELLLAAQNDMRWTTSPRLSLELALVRATIPETDPTPVGALSRLERLERLANLEPGSTVPSADVAPGPEAPGQPLEASEPAGAVPATPRRRLRRPSRSPPCESPRPPRPSLAAESDAPHAASAASVDVAMLRRSWTSLLDHLSQNQQAGAARSSRRATPAAFDGESLELAFPPSFRNNLRQVAARPDKLQEALAIFSGIRPPHRAGHPGSPRGRDRAGRRGLRRRG